jgi:nucleotidyltransferase/DNA polymerase involved in DNA repair
MPFACIFVPDFPVEAILRAEPELRAQPVAVLEGKSPLQKVFATNANARAISIDAGMTKIQVEPWTELILRPRSALQETAAHAALLDCAQSFSPRVEETAPDTVLLDLSGLESLFGSLPRIASEIARRTSNLGLESNVATAFNPDTAMFAARGFTGVTVVPEGKESERLGNLPLTVLFPDPNTPDPSEPTENFLETFNRWGVRNLRALCALPEVELSERLGQQGVRLQQLARGAISRTLVPVDPPQIFEEAMELEHPIVLLEPLAFLLSHMLDQLCTRLAARALAAQELRLHLELDSGFQSIDDFDCHGATGVSPVRRTGTSTVPSNLPCHPERSETGVPHPNGAPFATLGWDHERSKGPMHSSRTTTKSSKNDAANTTHSQLATWNYQLFTRTLQLPVPMLDAKVFLKLLQLDLKAHPPGAPIMKIYLSVEPARPRNVQGGLFLPPTPEPEKLELTLARIAGMVGEDKVGSMQLLDTHHPEAFRMQHFSPAEPKGEKEKSDDAPSSAPITALRMFRPPLRAKVTLHDGQPKHVVCPKRKEVQGEILWMAGPWRSSGDWWEQDGWARDEWDIAIQSSAKLSAIRYPLSAKKQSSTNGHSSEEPTLALYRLVHDRLGGEWFVEGTYD